MTRKRDVLKPGLSEGPRIDLGVLVRSLEPFVPDMIRTLGLAARPRKDESGQIHPGDVKAAIAGLDLITRYLSNSNTVRGQELLSVIAQIRRSPDQQVEIEDE